MQALLLDFTGAVAAVNRSLDELAELGQEKRQLIIAGKVKELDSLIHKEGNIVNNLERLESSRYRLQTRLGEKWGIKGEELSAQEIMRRVQKDYPECFSQLQEAINHLDYNLTRLKAINMHNNELIEQSLDYIKEMETAINGDIAGTYSNEGHQADEAVYHNKNLLDKKV